MPEYKLRLWDAKSFDISSVPFTREAFACRKWAFVADYIRLYALYHEGGIYLDSDVQVFKPFDRFLEYDFFTSHELHPYNFTEVERAKLDHEGTPLNKDQLIYGLHVQAAIMGGARGNLFLRDCLEFYNDKHFIGSDGRPQCEEFIIGPHMSKRAEKYGYRYNPNEQMLQNNMIICRPEVFVGDSRYLTSDSYASHLCNGSWKEPSGAERLEYDIRNRYPRLSWVASLWTRLNRKVRKLFSQ